MAFAAAGCSIPEKPDLILGKYALSKRKAGIRCLRLVGKSNKEIEDALFIAMAKVKIHVYKIYRKIKVRSRMQLLLRIQQETKKFE